MDEAIKVKLITTSIDVLFTHGLPAMAKMINALNDKDKITLEDIESLKGNLNAESYFDDK